MAQYTSKENMIQNLNEMVENANKVLTDTDLLDFQVPITFAVSGIKISKKDLVAKLGLLRDLLEKADDSIVYAPGQILCQSHDDAGNRMVAEQRSRLEARAKLAAPAEKKGA